MGVNCSNCVSLTHNWWTLLAGNQLFDTKFENCSNWINWIWADDKKIFIQFFVTVKYKSSIFSYIDGQYLLVFYLLYMFMSKFYLLMKFYKLYSILYLATCFQIWNSNCHSYCSIFTNSQRTFDHQVLINIHWSMLSIRYFYYIHQKWFTLSDAYCFINIYLLGIWKVFVPLTCFCFQSIQAKITNFFRLFLKESKIFKF